MIARTSKHVFAAWRRRDGGASLSWRTIAWTGKSRAFSRSARTCAVFDRSTALGIPTAARFTWSNSGARPLLVIEVTSPDHAKTISGTRSICITECGCPFTPSSIGEPRRRVRARLAGLPGDTECRILSRPPLDERGRLWLEPVGLWLRPKTAGRLYDDRAAVPRLREVVRTAGASKPCAEARRVSPNWRRRPGDGRRRGDGAAEARMKEMEAELQRLRDERRPSNRA